MTFAIDMVKPGSTLSGPRPQSSSSRPSSSASYRTTSRLSNRPASRLSQRPFNRHSTRLAPLYQALVTQTTGFSVDTEPGNFTAMLEYVSKNVEQHNKQPISLDLGTVGRQLKGHAQKARIHSRDNVAKAIELSYTRLKSEVERGAELDQDIKISKLPDHLQLLILLSTPCTSPTLEYADHIIEAVQQSSVSPAIPSWNDIILEEPFRGQHWQGAYGLPPGSVIEDWDDDDHTEDSSPPLSPLLDSEVYNDVSSSVASDVPMIPDPSHSHIINHNAWKERQAQSLRHRDELEALRRRQYWRDDWSSDVPVDRKFDINGPSTLGPSLHRVLGECATLGLAGLEKERYINEHDAVREILKGLQGHRNMMLDVQVEGCPSISISPINPRLLHLTSTSQLSIMSPFVKMATTLTHLRRFTQSIFSAASDPTISQSLLLHSRSQTLQAFAEAVDLQVRVLEHWCAKKDEGILLCRDTAASTAVISLLDLEKTVRDTFSETYNALLQILRQTVYKSSLGSSLHDPFSTSILASRLLDTIYDSLRHHDTTGDAVTTSTLTQVFVLTANPIWSMVGRWLDNGMPSADTRSGHEWTVKLDREFFIESNDLALVDPDFWTDGYVLRKSSIQNGIDSPSSDVPVFLQSISKAVLSAGKSIGLLRALESNKIQVADTWAKHLWGRVWPSFAQFISHCSELPLNDPMIKTPRSCHETATVLEAQAGGRLPDGIITSAYLSLLIHDQIKPFCVAADEALKQVLYNDCNLWNHLFSMEDLYFMRKGDSMSQFCDVVFARIDSHQPWSDYHFLNTTFRDVASVSSIPWIETALVRLSYKGNKDTVIHRTVRALEGLSLEYDAPFPLTFIFHQDVSQIYGAIFVFLLQIRRAKSVLDRILVRDSLAKAKRMANEMKPLYAMRSKLSWFVNTLLNFVMTHVLQTELINFHRALRAANSLDEIVGIHQNHLGRLEGRCLLHQKVSALRRAVISILDISVTFSDYFTAFAGDRTHDISHSVSVATRRHRSRRLGRQRRNVVAFSQPSAVFAEESQDSDSEYEVNLDAGLMQEPTVSLETSSISYSEGGIMAHIGKMSSELDGLMRFIRRGAESLASGSGETAPTFEVFAFALEDWDR